MLFLIVLLPFVMGQQKCHTTTKGINAGLSHTLAHSLNDLRNRVATGQISFEGSESSSNMNVIHWSHGYAQRAQACSEKCPAKSSTCHQHQEYGVLTMQRQLSSSKPTSAVINHWFEDNSKAKQLLLARATHFGCGKAQDNKIEYIVCYFDKKYDGLKQAFLGGPIGAACKLGKSQKYVGLCATASGSLIQQRNEQSTDQLLLLNSGDFL